MTGDPMYALPPARPEPLPRLATIAAEIAPAMAMLATFLAAEAGHHHTGPARYDPATGELRCAYGTTLYRLRAVLAVRSCGKRYRTEDEAQRSKLVLAGTHQPAQCKAGCFGWHAKPKPAPALHEESFPAAVALQIDTRDSQPDDIDHCVHCGTTRGLHRHHRRIKGMGGDPRAHTDCSCNGVTACWACHSWAHSYPREAAAEGLIVPGATVEPGTIAVLVHGQDDAEGVLAYPTCDGRWVTEAPAPLNEEAEAALWAHLSRSSLVAAA